MIQVAMIVCPNCNHHNPEGATQCEACYTPLPEMMPCPNCGAQVQVDANFCGQCGFSIQAAAEPALPTALEASSNASSQGGVAESLAAAVGTGLEYSEGGHLGLENVDLNRVEMEEVLEPTAMVPAEMPAEGEVQETGVSGDAPDLGATEPSVTAPSRSSSKTQLQSSRAILLHLRTNVEMSLPDNLSVIHIGKPNDRVPPDIDISGFPDSEVVSRVHADIRVEGDAYYIEDLGSSNGTYINNLPLAPGNRHRLRMGDRIALGKGDLVTFLFQVA